MKNVGLWIDHEKAFVFEMGTQKLRMLHSQGEESISPMGSFDIAPDNRADRRRNRHLKAWYKEVMRELVNAENILVIGPGIAKREIAKEMMADRKLKDKIAAIQSAGLLSEKQLCAKVRGFFMPKAENTVPAYRRAPGS